MRDRRSTLGGSVCRCRLQDPGVGRGEDGQVRKFGAVLVLNGLVALVGAGSKVSRVGLGRGSKGHEWRAHAFVCVGVCVSPCLRVFAPACAFVCILRGRYMIKGVGLSGASSTALEQVGYSLADVTAKAIFGILIWRIAHEKTLAMEEDGLLSGK